MKLRSRLGMATSMALAVFSWTAISAAEHGRYRLTWRDDPTSTMVIGWEQTGGLNPKVHWDSVDHGTDPAAYANSRGPDRVEQELGMSNHFVRLSGLTADTSYYFVVA